MRLALALETLVGFALVVVCAAAVDALRPGSVASGLSSPRLVVVLVGLSVCWLMVNGPGEGPVLVVLDRRHGLTLADLLVVPPVLIAGLLVVRALLNRLA